MPYVIKATYHGQMRKLRSLNSHAMPNWTELTTAIQHAFWRVERYSLANIQITDRYRDVTLDLGSTVSDAAGYGKHVVSAIQMRSDLSNDVIIKFDIIDHPAPRRHRWGKTPSPASLRVVDPPQLPRGWPAYETADKPSSSEPAWGGRTPPTRPRVLVSVDRRNEPWGSPSPPPSPRADKKPLKEEAKAPEPCCSHEKAKADLKQIAQKFLEDFAKAAAPFDLDDVATPRMAASEPPRGRASSVRIICDGCDKDITGERHKCKTCADFDFCADCFTRNVNDFGTYGHPHPFQTMAVLPGQTTWTAVNPHIDNGCCRRYPSVEVRVETVNANKGNPFEEATPLLSEEQDTRPVHEAYCDHCQTTIRGVRHKCADCLDYDLCEKCILKRRSVHTRGHKFIALQEPGEVLFVREEDDAGVQGASATTSADGSSDAARGAMEVNQVHAAHCDVCDQQIVGVRHKCLNCPDYDLCDGCHPHRAVLHDPAHKFFHINKPVKIVIHRVYDDDHRRPGRADRGRTRVVPTAAAPVMTTAGANVQVPAGSVPAAVHAATCDLCSSRIIGARYKCADCPDYDTCESCFSITPDQHPGHSFIRITDPKDFIRRKPAHLRRRPSHHAACDNCNTSIPSSGARFKCTHPSCPDFDLCPNCESLPHPVHPIEHALLKLRVPAAQVEPQERLPHEAEVETFKNFEVHAATCDHCDHQIIGVRYKCAVCDDFDLCARCEAKEGVHPAEHVLLKIKKAAAEESVAPARAESSAAAAVPQADAQRPRGGLVSPVGLSDEPVVQQMQQRRSTPPMFLSSILNPSTEDVKQPKTEDVPPTSIPVETEATPIPQLDGHFVADLSIPDGHALPLNSHFVKRWQLFNPGPLAWPETTVLQFTGGERMGAAESVEVGKVEEGQFVDVQVEMQAGPNEGKQVGFWSLAYGGKVFGHRLWVDIDVVNVANASAYGSGSGSSLESSAIVMPSAPSVPGSAPPSAGPASPTYEFAAHSPRVSPEADGSEYQSISSRNSVVSMSEVSDEEWDAEMMSQGLEREVLERAEQALAEYAHAEELADRERSRERTGYVMVYDDSEEDA